MSRAGDRTAICRQSSSPMLPPAPVTSTVRPLTRASIAASSRFAAGRPRMSSTEIGRMSVARTRPPTSSAMEGTTSTRRRAAEASALTSRTRRTRAAGSARMISVTPNFSASSGMRSGAPITGIPWMWRPCLAGLSSRKQTGSMPCPLRLSSSAASAAPAWPAPTIAMRSTTPLAARSGSPKRSRRARIETRKPMNRMSERWKSTKVTPRGIAKYLPKPVPAVSSGTRSIRAIAPDSAAPMRRASGRRK